MSDRIAVFSDGRIEQVGTPGEIYERPANEFVAGFVGTSNVIERDGAPLHGAPGEDPPARATGESRARRWRLGGTVREVAYLGSVTRYVVELDDGETIVVLRQNLETSAAQALERARPARAAGLAAAGRVGARRQTTRRSRAR